MIRLNLSREPAWLDLAAGVRVHVAPLTTALMMAVRNDPALEAVADDASDDVKALAFAKAVGRRAVLAWEGVGGEDGEPAPVSPETVDALLEIYPLFEAFPLGYVNKGLALAAEKNASAPSPNGGSAGARPTATPARKPARTARRG